MKYLKRNYTVRGGEIDIIAKKNDCVAFVEVKTRKLDAFQSGEEAVTKSKQKRIIKTAKKIFQLALMNHAAEDLTLQWLGNER